MTPDFPAIMTEKAFMERFRPLPNTLVADAPFDFGNGGCLYETNGAELAYVRLQPEQHVWTLFNSEDGLVIGSGFHFLNRLGYILTAEPRDAGSYIEVPLG